MTPATTTPPAAPPARYHTLDAMRGVAALLVAVFHFGQAGREYAPEGYLAVDLFFGLSGFVIALNYTGRLRAGMRWQEFARLRLVRLYPIYLIGVLLGVARMVVGAALRIPHSMSGGTLALAALFSLFMLPAPLISAGSGAGGEGSLLVMFPLNGPSWSLFMEVGVNLLFAVALVRLSSGWLLAICAGAGLWLGAHIGAPLFFNTGWAWQNLDMGIARTLYSFPLGVVAWRLAPARRRISSPVSLLVIVAMVALMVVPATGAMRGAYDMVCAFVALPLLLLVGIVIDLPARFRRPLGFLGDISYPVYAVHWPLVKLFALLAGRLHLGAAVATALFLAATLLGAHAISHWVDGPARRWLARALSPHPSRRLVPSQP